MKRIAILGSTGSIGRSTLSVVESYPDRFQVVSLAAGSNVEARSSRPGAGSPADFDGHRSATRKFCALICRPGNEGHRSCSRSAGTVKVATHPEADFVVSAIVGVAGLEATYEAVKAGKTIGLANKECLVAAGELITAEARRQGKPLLPIDSEHNAVHQCLRGGRMEEVERIWLTASGGPFLNTPKVAIFCDHGGTSAQSSHMEDGKADHHRFGDPDEQGIRGDRGLPFVQHAAQPGA